MIKKIVGICLLSIIVWQCKKENIYLLAKGQVGRITSATTVNDFKSIFSKDSLASHIGEGSFAASDYDEYLVFDKKGNHLLTIIPKQQHDSVSTVESIQIFDKKYKTLKGVGLSSTFSDITGNYSVNKVESTFTTAVLFINELNATITIDKKELGIKDFGTQKISLEQIPDLAKIKAMTIWFD
jgi:hypothetical protein